MSARRSPLARLNLPEFTPPPAVDSALDWFFFIVGGAGTVWLAALLVEQSFSWGWWGLTLIVVTHDSAVAKRAQRRLTIKQGKVTEKS